MNLPYGTRIIDISMEIYDGAPPFPGDAPCEVVPYHTIAEAGYNTTRLSLSSHHGTHLDAPLHFLDDGFGVDRIDLGKCVGPAVLIDMAHKAPRALIDVADLEPYADRVGEGARVVIRTGWDRVYPEPRYFSDFPSITLEAASWLADRKISLLGMDMPTPNGESDEAVTQVHRVLLRAEVVIVEWLARLDEIPGDAFYLVAAPLKIRGRDGSPIRALAIV